MSVEVTLPELGESVTEGTVTQWLKKVGDTVDVDEPLLEVSTDKVDTEVPSPVAGTVLKVLAEEDDTVAIGGVLAIIGDPSESESSSVPEPPAQEASSVTSDSVTSDSVTSDSVTSEDSKSEPAESEGTNADTPSSSAEGASVTLPELGESVTEGTVTRWLKEVGDTVDVDEPIVEVSTDKVDTEVPSPFAGTLLKIVADEDTTVEIGGVLGIVGDASAQSATPAASAPAAPESAPETPAAPPAPALAPQPAPAPKHEAPAAPAPAPATTEEPAAEPVPAPKHAAPSADSTSVYVTPIVRKLAAQLGVDLASVTGTGVGGRIRREDVQKAAPAPAAAPAAPAHTTTAAAPEKSPLVGTTQPLSRLRKVLGKSMVQSLQTQAQLTTVVEVDITNVARLRAAYKEEFLKQTGSKLSFMPFFVLAAVEQLPAFPMINSSIKDNDVIYHDGVNLNIAVETERGLYAPVIKGADKLTIRGLSEAIADLAKRARDNSLKPDDLMGGTFTLTNTGSRGALFDTPVVALPQSAILGTGVAVKKPSVITVDGQDVIAIRQKSHLALSYDHRIVDGADAAKYLSAIKQRLESADFAGNLGIDL